MSTKNRRNVSLSSSHLNSSWTNLFWYFLFSFFKDNFGFDTLSAIILVLWALILLFLLCDFGQKLINQFELFENEIYKCKWYLFPINMQQIFAFAMVNVQQLAPVQGFGNIELTRETSEKVAKLKSWLNITNLSFTLNILFFIFIHIRHSTWDFLILWRFASYRFSVWFWLGLTFPLSKRKFSISDQKI